MQKFEKNQNKNRTKKSEINSKKNITETKQKNIKPKLIIDNSTSVNKTVDFKN